MTYRALPWWPLLLILCTGCGVKGTIAEVLERVCGDRLPDGEPDDAPDGDMARYTVDSSEAVCNDGSPAIVYIRGHTDPAHANDWLIHIEPGGMCGDAETCAERFCSRTAKMSTNYSGPRLQGIGTNGAEESNPFAAWNHVRFKYCSSDNFLGRSGVVEFRGKQNYSLQFEGHLIIYHALNDLDAGLSSDDDGETVPPLIEAQRIVWAGSSAGATGAALHLDWVADRYPAAEVTGFMEGMITASPSIVPASVQNGLFDELGSQWDVIFDPVFQAFTDDDCNGYRCIDGWDVFRHQVTTPLVVRRDLYDSAYQEGFATTGATEEEIVDYTVRSLRLLSEQRPDMGILAPACGQHIVALTEHYGTSSVEDPERQQGSYSVQSAIEVMVEERKPVVAIDDGTRDWSTCP